MIIVKLMGGLGNQMFQYAAAKSLSLRHGTLLKLDLSFFEGDQVGNTPRKYELDQFLITAEKASQCEISAMKSLAGRTLLKSVVKIFSSQTLYCEKGFHFDHNLLTHSDNVYLDGYWQSWRYFADISKIIKREFVVKTTLIGRNAELNSEIQAVNSVSLHVRRGDYVNDKKTSEVHGICNMSYYQMAEDLVAESLGNPHFFVFSDDPEWVAENLKLHHPVRYVNHNGSMAHEDLRLMSMCKHHVIANSSFSWWGAWLSINPDKMVIAPKRWFNDLSINTSDLIPSDWQQL